MTLTDLWRSSEDDDTFEAVAVAVCPAQATRTDLWTSTGEHFVHGSVAVTPLRDGPLVVGPSWMTEPADAMSTSCGARSAWALVPAMPAGSKSRSTSVMASRSCESDY